MSDQTLIESSSTAPFPKLELRPYLIVLYPREQFRRVEIPRGTLVIGRSAECGLVLTDELISRQHCELLWDGKSVQVRDLGSTNGTFVDGAPVMAPRILGSDQHLQIGKLILKVSFRDAAEIAFESELFEAATTDPLTRISNRRAFFERAQGEWAAARRKGDWLHVLMLDADHFKRINDSLGHGTGDFVLHELAHLFDKSRRTEDLLARYGGEEFILLLSGIEPEQAVAFAERLRQTVVGHRFAIEERHVPVTVSIGVSSRRGDSLPALADLVARADAALYMAKHNGRNCVVADQ